VCRAEAVQHVSTLDEAEALGIKVADQLCAAGARRMLPESSINIA
jgi:hypothetical protein